MKNMRGGMCLHRKKYLDCLEMKSFPIFSDPFPAQHCDEAMFQERVSLFVPSNQDHGTSTSHQCRSYTSNCFSRMQQSCQLRRTWTFISTFSLSLISKSCKCIFLSTQCDEIARMLALRKDRKGLLAWSMVI